MKRKAIAVTTTEISRIVQEKLFDLGYRWNPNQEEYFDYVVKEHGTEGYIIMNGDGSLANAPKKFIMANTKVYKEISMYDLFHMEKIEGNVSVILAGKKRQISYTSAKALNLIK